MRERIWGKHGKRLKKKKNNGKRVLKGACVCVFFFGGGFFGQKFLFEGSNISGGRLKWLAKRGNNLQSYIFLLTRLNFLICFIVAWHFLSKLCQSISFHRYT